MTVYFLRAATVVVMSLCFITGFSQITPITPNDQNSSDNQTTATPSKEDTSASLPSTSWKKKIVLGGNLGAQFGDITAIDVSPTIGYRITTKLISGVGFTYQYVSYTDPTGYYASYKSDVIGGKVFSQYDLFYGLFADAEFEDLWLKVHFSNDLTPDYKTTVPGLFVGAGYNFEIGSNAYFQVIALYDLLWSADNLLYDHPLVLRAGFNIGL